MNGATAVCVGLGLLGAYCASPRRTRLAPSDSDSSAAKALAAADALTNYYAEQQKAGKLTPPSSASSPARPWRVEAGTTITLEPGRQYCLSFLLSGLTGAIATPTMVRNRLLNEDGAKWKAVSVWNKAAEVPADWPGTKPVEPDAGDRFWVLAIPAKRMQFERQPEIEELHSRAELAAVSGEFFTAKPIPNADPADETARPSRLGLFVPPLQLLQQEPGSWRAWPARDAIAFGPGVAFAMEFQFPIAMRVTPTQLGQVLEAVTSWATLRVYSDQRRLPKGWPTLARMNSAGRFWAFGIPAANVVARRPKELIQVYLKESSVA